MFSNEENFKLGCILVLTYAIILGCIMILLVSLV